MSPRSSPISKCPPPHNFTPAGILDRVEHSFLPPDFAKRRARSRQQAAGISYEARAQRILFDDYPNYIPSPWLHFLPRGGRWRWCQPDGFLLDFTTGTITIVEIKLRHTHHSWWQIRRLYEPVLAKLFGPHWRFRACEVVRWFDGSDVFPEPYIIVHNLNQVTDSVFGIHILVP